MRLIRLSLMVLLPLLGLAAALAVWHFQRFLATPLALDAETETLVIERGQSVHAIAAGLGERGWIAQPDYLVLLAKATGKDARVKAGEFEIKRGTRPAELLDQLVAGQVIQHRLTLVEGWTFRQVRAALAADPVLEQTLAGLDDEEVMARLGKPGRHPEGLFYPDTYGFPRGSTDLDFLQRALRTMEQRLAEEWEARSEGLPLETPYEALILASIVERESAVAEERPLIAAVFISRLRKNMRLQTDPTVIYGLGEAFDGNLRRRDLLGDTPYNTYTRGGLPPTPIAMPSGAAIHATLHPAETDALYFVSKGDGSHYFSTTLEEHNDAVVRYQLGGRRPAPRREQENE